MSFVELIRKPKYWLLVEYLHLQIVNLENRWRAINVQWVSLTCGLLSRAWIMVYRALFRRRPRDFQDKCFSILREAILDGYSDWRNEKNERMVNVVSNLSHGKCYVSKSFVFRCLQYPRIELRVEASIYLVAGLQDIKEIKLDGIFRFVWLRCVCSNIRWKCAV